MSEAQASPRTIHFVSLGCPKNRVDTEVMLGIAEESGYRQVDDPAEAGVIVVNTCGFIDAAKEESLQTILELSAHKQTGACERLVVTGCLSQRYPEELAEGLPEVDHLLGSSDMLKLRRVLSGAAERVLVGNPADWVVEAGDPRRISTRGRSAYVKIAEGCNRRCSFCVIPEIRGKQRSRTADDVVLEVERLVAQGVIEINLVSQDTLAYGRDRDGGVKLSELVRRVADVAGVHWVRLFYLYPEKLDDELVELLAGHPRVVPYVDMPLQHAADAMLRRMRRGHGGKRLYELVESLRRRIPELTLRSAFIVGHPGETDAEFEELVAFVRFAELDRMAVFHYSDEPSAHAHALSGKVEAKTILARGRRLSRVQRAIGRRKARALVGRRLEVLVEGPDPEHELVLVGRHAGQAPEIDGSVYLSGGEALPGELCQVRITETTDYDLLGEVEEAGAPVPAATTRVARREANGRVALRTLPGTASRPS